MNFNPNSYSQIIQKYLILRDYLGTLGSYSKSFRTMTQLKNIIRKALDYPLIFLRKGTQLKSIVLKEYLIIPDYLLRYLVQIYLVVLTTNQESNYSLLSVTYNYQAITPFVSLLGSKLATRLVYSSILGYILITLVYPKLKYLNSSYNGLVPPLNSLSKSTYLYYSSYQGRLCFTINNPIAYY